MLKPTIGNPQLGAQATARVQTAFSDNKKIVNKAPKSKGRPKTIETIENIQEALPRYGQFRYNTTLNRVEVKWNEGQAPDEYIKNGEDWAHFSDTELNDLWRRMNLEGIVMSNEKNLEKILGSHFIPSYNPLKEYCKSLPEWKRGDKDYIKEFTDKAVLKDNTPENREYFHWTFEKWFVKMVAGWNDPNIFNEYIFLLIGGQGTFKTTFFIYLLPKELWPFRLDKFDVDNINKDSYIALVNNGLINIDDLGNFRQSQISKVKNITSLPRVKERLPFGRVPQDMPRNASFCATSNNTNPLIDPNGEERRFLAHHIASLPSLMSDPPNYEGIFSQAYALYKESPNNYLFTPEETKMVNKHNQNFREVNEAEEMLLANFKKPESGLVGIEALTASEITNRLTAYSRVYLKPADVGKALTRLGFDSVMRHGQKRYKVHQLSAEEIKKDSLDFLTADHEEKMAAQKAKEPVEQRLNFNTTQSNAESDPLSSGILPEI